MNNSINCNSSTAITTTYLAPKNIVGNKKAEFQVGDSPQARCSEAKSMYCIGCTMFLTQDVMTDSENVIEKIGEFSRSLDNCLPQDKEHGSQILVEDGNISCYVIGDFRERPLRPDSLPQTYYLEDKIKAKVLAFIPELRVEINQSKLQASEGCEH